MKAATLSLRDPRDEETCNDIAWALNKSEPFVVASDGCRVFLLVGELGLAVSLCDDIARQLGKPVLSSPLQ